MRTLVVATIAALLSSSAAFGQQHGLAQPAIDAAHQAALDAKQRKQCKAMFGEQMGADGHTADQHGHMATSRRKPMSAVEMKAMHEKCEALMAKNAATAPKP
jgi:hypothetical protein